MVDSTKLYEVAVIGAGPGGLAVAASLNTAGIETLVIEAGSIGQSWADYPSECRMLSATTPSNDENGISTIPFWSVFPNIEHPSHRMYQRYLEKVAKHHHLTVRTQTKIDQITREAGRFLLHSADPTPIYARIVVWATGMYATPNESLDCEGCFIHYSRIQDWKHLEGDDLVVIGGANGATDVVIQLIKPDRHVTLLCPDQFEAPQPADCLWKENRQLVRDLEKQGLVDIVENWRVLRITHDDAEYRIQSTNGGLWKSACKPIVCIGFLPNIGPIRPLVDDAPDSTDHLLDLDEKHQSKKTPGLFVAGTIGKHHHAQGFIKEFRLFDTPITQAIREMLA